jgi:hypothetical protein
VDRARRVVRRRLGPQERAGEARALVQDRQLQQVLAEDDDKVVIGITRGSGTADAREGTAQRLRAGPRSSSLLKPSTDRLRSSARSLSLEGLVTKRRVSANELFGFGNEPEVERQLVLEAWAPATTERIVAEDGPADGAETPRGEIVVAPKRGPRSRRCPGALRSR